MNDKTKAGPFVYGIVTFGLVGFSLFLVYPLLGIFTGVYGICAFAPKWWEDIYERPFILVPLLATVSGVIVSFLKRLSINKNKAENDYLP